MTQSCRSRFGWLPRRIVVGLVVALHGAGASASPVPISDTAREQFRIGVVLLQDPAGPRYEEAYRAFKAAYADSPSPKILGNIGLCAMKLERDGEAIDAYERYLAEAPGIEPVERKQIERDLEVLRGAAVRLHVAVRPSGVVLVDERRPVQGTAIVNEYRVAAGSLDARIRPGSHRFTVRKQGYQPETFELEAAPGAQLERSVELKLLAGPADQGTRRTGETPPSGEPSRPVPVGVYVGLAATGAFAVATGVVGGLSLAHHKKFDDAMQAGDLTEADSLRDDGLVLNVTTDVLLGATAVAAGVTAILFFTRPESVPESANETTRLVVAPFASAQAGGLVLGGHY